MFMTLRASKKGSNGTGMEQIATADAGRGGAETRAGLGRRPVCAQCQSKKVRFLNLHCNQLATKMFLKASMYR
jgi:hypothetical protein